MSENESGSSRDAKADSSEADDDSSELDESECDRRTANYVKYMRKSWIFARVKGIRLIGM